MNSDELFNEDSINESLSIHDESMTLRYAESASDFLVDVQRLRKSFRTRFSLHEDPENGERYYREKDVGRTRSTLLMFPVAFHYDRLYEAWRAAKELNEVVKMFDGDCVLGLSAAVRETPSNGTRLFDTFNAFNQEVKRLQLLLATKEHFPTTHTTVRRTRVLESELTKDARPTVQWLTILGHANEDKSPISKSTFHDRIHGRGSNPLDAVAVLRQKYRLRVNQLPTDMSTEGSRNAVIEAATPSKRGKRGTS